MIIISNLLKEKRESSIDNGVLMAMVPKKYCSLLVNFGKKIISEKDLFKINNEFGREKECHVTILYGFTKDLNELEIRRIIEGTKPFNVTITGISKFTPPEEYEVVKFDIKSDTLIKLHEKCKKLPFESDFPDYHPHLTIAYVKKDKFNESKEGINISIPIDVICYSTAQQIKSYYKL